MAHTLFEVDRPIATLTFNRLEARNATNWEMCESLLAACDRVDQDATCVPVSSTSPSRRSRTSKGPAAEIERTVRTWSSR